MIETTDSPQKPPAEKSITLYIPRRLDTFSAPFLYEDLENILRGETYLILDFSRTRYIDSVGISVLREGFIKCRNQSARLILRSVKPHIKALLQTANLFEIGKRKPIKLPRRQRIVRSRSLSPTRQQAS